MQVFIVFANYKDQSTAKVGKHPNGRIYAVLGHKYLSANAKGCVTALQARNLLRKKEKEGENGCISEARLGCRREAELIMVRAVVKENEVSSRAISLFPAQPPTE